MNHHICLRYRSHDGRLHIITHIMGNRERHVVVEFKVQLHEVDSAGAARPQIVNPQNARVRAGNLDNLVPFGLGKFLVQQFTGNVTDDVPCGFKRVDRYRQREQRINTQPTKLRKHQR